MLTLLTNFTRWDTFPEETFDLVLVPTDAVLVIAPVNCGLAFRSRDSKVTVPSEEFVVSLDVLLTE